MLPNYEKNSAVICIVYPYSRLAGIRELIHPLAILYILFFFILQFDTVEQVAVKKLKYQV